MDCRLGSHHVKFHNSPMSVTRTYEFLCLKSAHLTRKIKFLSYHVFTLEMIEKQVLYCRYQSAIFNIYVVSKTIQEIWRVRDNPSIVHWDSVAQGSHNCFALISPLFCSSSSVLRKTPITDKCGRVKGFWKPF